MIYAIQIYYIVLHNIFCTEGILGIFFKAIIACLSSSIPFLFISLCFITKLRADFRALLIIPGWKKYISG